MEDKVYQQEIIEENPFPGQELVLATTASVGGTNGTFNPATTKEQKLPRKRVSTELLSTALNTRSRKILEQFELVQSGGFQIGDFKNGISGDLRITPNGITARDIAGLTTFAIDGSDGSAIFKGLVRASRFENDLFSVDEDGNVIAQSISFLESASTSKAASLNQQITVLDTPTELADSAITITTPRSLYVLLLAQIQIFHFRASGTGDWSGTSTFVFSRNSNDVFPFIYSSHENVGGDDVGDALGLPIHIHAFQLIAPGVHTFNIKATLTASNNNGALNIYSYKFTLIELGGSL